MGWLKDIFHKQRHSAQPVPDESREKKEFFENIESQHRLLSQKCDELFKYISETFDTKIIEMGAEAARQWRESLIENTKNKYAVKIKAKDMHHFGENFYRITKSSVEAALKSTEAHPYVSSKPNTVSEDVYGTYGLCFTTAKDVVRYLGYGDELSELNFNKDEIKRFGLEDEVVGSTPHETNEYFAKKVLIKDVESLKFPETLKKIIKNSSNQSLLMTICAQDVLKYDEHFKRLGFIDTQKAWGNVMMCASSFDRASNEMCDFIRNNIDRIIPDLTIDDKIAQINSSAMESIRAHNHGDNFEKER